MGLSLFKRCYTNAEQPAPNPNPTRWVMIGKAEFAKGYVLKVRYLDCTNYEGKKVMVFRGKYTVRQELDPHFCENDGTLIARFRPDEEGWAWACILAGAL